MGGPPPPPGMGGTVPGLRNYFIYYFILFYA